jgi:hypothetical protein
LDKLDPALTKPQLMVLPERLLVKGTETEGLPPQTV